jgi:hypothetical protein
VGGTAISASNCRIYIGTNHYHHGGLQFFFKIVFIQRDANPTGGVRMTFFPRVTVNVAI